MSKQIGIKLADGTFYPVLEEDLPKRKILDLTTVQDNQTTVMVDLYRSETGTMDDAEYVDTLQISGLNPHPSGEPDLSLSVKLDENDTLSAEVIDAESGRHSDTTVRLISRTPEERSEAPDYALNETIDADDALPPKGDDTTVMDAAAFADDAFPAEFDTVGDDSENAVSAAESTETDDSELPPMPDFTESVPVDFSPEDFEVSDVPDTPFENDEQEPAEADTDEPADGGEREDDTLMEPSDDATAAFAEDDLPPKEDDTTVMDTAAFADDAFPAEFDTVGDDSENAVPAAESTETDDSELPPMPDFTESVPVDFSPEDFEVSDVPDTPFENDEQEPAEADTDEPADGGEREDDTLMEPSDDATAAFADDALPPKEVDTTVMDTAAFADDAFPAEFDTVGDDSENAVPAAEFTETDDLELPPMPDFADDDSTAAEPVLHEDTLPDFSKFELPDFDELHKTEEPNHTPLFTDDDFDDPAFHADFSATDGTGGELDFSGLYTDEFPEEEREPERKKKKLTVPVIICIICAIICLGVLAGILLYVPSQISIQITRKSDAELQNHEPAAPVTTLPEPPVRIEPLPVQPAKEPEPAPLPEAPAAEENRIVIADTPAVIPAPPPEPAKEPEPVRYKIKWGDTLWDLADSYYNNPWLYKKIAKANGIRNPDYIISGTYIMIPPK